jgi:hypothetical protein
MSFFFKRLGHRNKAAALFLLACEELERLMALACALSEDAEE